ncbi:phosphatase PAP2 family protein [Cellulomonas marina]|uniref:PAP2 superfamily protein n=1 Tax=Cellulomonas marina TaxID=988821 RepID=A0A1I0WRL7_9CELL|nr:phosphatase PAP2 family protein [Cellulomonas marina]GIG27802.1 hypothetical protein Cma02nite_04020 [Cellulomonas marina]SFA90790.1 PAP2 superfamily protein [Cellulomonas marina]
MTAPTSVIAPGDRPAGPARGTRPGLAALCLLVAAAAAAGVLALHRLLVGTATGQGVDQLAWEGALHGQSRLWGPATAVLEVVSVGFIAAVLLAAATIAVARRRPWLAVQVALLMGGANVTTRVLKHHLLERPDLGIGSYDENTLPSGHTTAAASVSAALLLVVPPRVRPVVAVLGAGYTAATGVSTLVGQWHRPSDVVAALLVVLAWGAVVCALVALRPTVRPTVGPTVRPVVGRTRTGRAPRRTAAGVTGATLLVGALAAGVAGALALGWTAAQVRAGEVVEDRTGLLTAYAGGAAASVAATALVFGLLLLLREAAGRPSWRAARGPSPAPGTGAGVVGTGGPAARARGAAA